MILKEQLPTHCMHISHAFAHDQFQNNSQMLEHNLTICPGLLDSYHHKGEILLDTLILRTRCGLTTTTHKVNAITWKENIQHYQSKEVQYAAKSRKNYADTFMGLQSTNPGTLYTEGYTVNNVYYREMLWAWLRPASLTEYQGMVKKGVA
jgi:hypothetical protein